ncbi:MAG: ABC transporter ATP-binding protein/permease [Acidaminococcus sp.]|jgi:ATP-binding cassette subfamily B protein|nr:ABC transporter ATP-binding protein/permease [Acidaminococcus sp.]MCI2099780.1 ABC transporter ATP-binding protein/permease [Acidaminococcus sp.]MCI2113950.1 ABC transporter ATP-binding protein/permease [Acidaminococcus sp.]MCI2117093.1 ABC transporter ATP-binding protein/permease [Acidaminococcus sp.]
MLKILKYLKKKEWVYAAFCVFFIVLQVWLDLKLPDYMSEVTRLVETEGSAMDDILSAGGKMLACAVGSMAAAIVTVLFASKTAAGLSRTLRDLVYNKTLDFPMQEVHQFSADSLINRTTNDVTQIQTLVAMGLQAIIKAPITAVWAIVKISNKNWQWTLSTAVAVAILVIVLGITLVYAVPRFQKIQTLNDKLNTVTREQVAGVRVVRAYNAEAYQEKKFDKQNEIITENNTIANRVMALMFPTMTLLNSGLSLAVYWIGAYLISAAAGPAKLVIFSDMVVFLNYAMQIIMSFMLLNMIFILLPRAEVSANRIVEVLDTPVSITDGTVASAPGEKGTVEFRDVSFRYPEAGGDVLQHLSFKVNRGETCALIGATGSGKTTAINLIPRFYDASAGEVLVDGVDVKAYKKSELRSKIGYCSQRAKLFSGTVRTNILFGENGKAPGTEEDVKEALAVSKADEFVSKMPKGEDASISQNGTNVSGGQKQRISIARAVARKPEIFIFDDSFSALDYKTDREVRKQLAQKTADATKIIVAQRIGTIRDADQILVLEHGSIVGKGTHDELMKNCKVYQEIALSQLSKEELANA